MNLWERIQGICSKKAIIQIQNGEEIVDVKETGIPKRLSRLNKHQAFIRGVNDKLIYIKITDFHSSHGNLSSCIRIHIETGVADIVAIQSHFYVKPVIGSLTICVKTSSS